MLQMFQDLDKLMDLFSQSMRNTRTIQNSYQFFCIIFSSITKRKESKSIFLLMNKYFLTFKNKHTEALYQTTCIGKVRVEMFALIILCLVFSFLVRIVQGSILQNHINVLMYIVMVTYFIAQYYIAKRYQKLLRISFVLLNHIFTIFLLIVEESTEPNSSYLRGANQMGSNILCILSGEYSDAIFSLLSIQIIRIFMVFLRSNNIEYFAIFSAIFLVIYASKQLHMYHKALRSQFLLTLKEKQWDNILNQIIKEIPYMLLTFNDDDLKFTSILVKNCGKIIENEENAIQFLRDSTNQGKSLEFIIFQEIKKFQCKHQETFNSQLLVNFQKSLLQIEFSIFQGNQPTVLIIFKDHNSKPNLCQLEPKYEKQQMEFINFIIGLCLRVQKILDKNAFLKMIRRKFVIQKLSKNVSSLTFVVKRISINQLLSKIQKLYTQKRINFLVNENIEVSTNLEILNLLLFSILESLETRNLNIHCKESEDSFEFRLLGQFKVAEVLTIIQNFDIKQNFIMKNLEIGKQTITFQLFKQAYIPFQI